MSARPAENTSAPDLIEPVLGFRLWSIDPDGNLRSLHHPEQTWPSDTLTARCRAGRPHQAPEHDCSCGVHAWYTPCPQTASLGCPGVVAGAIVLWGRVELHAQGMRGQHCRIVALALPPFRSRKREHVIVAAARLNVPAVPNRTLARVSALHGAPIPRALCPPRSGRPDIAPVGLVPRAAMAGLSRGRSLATRRR